MTKKKKFIYLLLIIIGAVTTYNYFDPFSSYPPWPKRAIVIGASSGIGKALAEVLSKNGYEVGLTGRRVELLTALQASLPTKSYVKQMDVSNLEQAKKALQELIEEMEGYHLMVVNSGVGIDDRERDWDKQKQVIDVNVLGFAMMVHEALEHFIDQRSGHVVGISSIAALRSGPYAYTYSASKAFEARLLQGVRSTVKTLKLPIFVTDIKPGWVDTEMTKKAQDKFWEASPQEAAEQIYHAIEKKRSVAYVTKRWGFIALVLNHAPDWLFDLVA